MSHRPLTPDDVLREWDEQGIRYKADPAPPRSPSARSAADLAHQLRDARAALRLFLEHFGGLPTDRDGTPDAPAVGVVYRTAVNWGRACLPEYQEKRC